MRERIAEQLEFVCAAACFRWVYYIYYRNETKGIPIFFVSFILGKAFAYTQKKPTAKKQKGSISFFPVGFQR